MKELKKIREEVKRLKALGTIQAEESKLYALNVMAEVSNLDTSDTYVYAIALQDIIEDLAILLHYSNSKI